MKTVLEVKKNGAKSILGSNPFGKVEGEIFSFSACTLIHIIKPCFCCFNDGTFLPSEGGIPDSVLVSLRF